jgi:hypothetical protein
MKANKEDLEEDYHPTGAEIKALCRPWGGKEACVWLLIESGKTNMVCGYWKRPDHIVRLIQLGAIMGKTEGCERVK